MPFPSSDWRAYTFRDGGWPDDTVELLSEVRLAETLAILPGGRVVLVVHERVLG